MLKKIKNITIALLGLTFVIVVHEFGHFSACKLFKVKTPIFSIGFDPAILSHQIGRTKFQIGLLLLGGYVSIDTQDLEKQSYIRKMIIILAGIFFNLLLFWIIVYYLSSKHQLQKAKSIFLLKKESHPADNQNQELEQLASEETTFSERTKQALPKKKRAIIGPIGIISMMERSVERGFDVFLYYLAIISLNVAIFNILPIPFFDGGQALRITINHFLTRPQIANRLINLFYLILFILLFILSIIVYKNHGQRSNKE